MSEARPSLTREILDRARLGDESATSELTTHLYAELRRLADGYLRRERVGHTLQATALIHEAYLRLLGGAPPDIQGRGHFLGIAARLMRQILVDHARTRGALKRGGDRVRVTLDGVLDAQEQRGLDVLDLHAAMERLAESDARKARVVELRFFGGLTMEETADVVGIARKTVEADWYMARAWLRRELGAGPDA